MSTHTERSALPIAAEAAWRHATSFEGINHELKPLMRMTAPRGVRSIEDVRIEPGRRLFRSWILLFGLIPFEYDDLTLVELEPGRRFLERSPMLSMRLWQHERIVEPRPGGGCALTDNVTFDSRVRFMRRLVRAIVAFQFRHRHRRLRSRFGGEPA